MRRLLAALAACAAATAAHAQSLNPDISVIGDVRTFVQQQDGSTDPKDGDVQIDLESVELALQGYLNPFARADVYVGYHDGEFELEEAYVTILRGLPLRTQLKAGKYRVDFGKLNLLHPHAYSFLDTPLVHREYLGEEGLIDVGLNLSWQVPVGRAVLTLSGNLLKGDFAEPHGHGHEDEPAHEGEEGAEGEEHADEAEIETALATTQRVGLFVPTGDYAGFEFGVSALQGKLDDLTGRKVTLFGADAKYRWAPDKYRSLTLQAEWIRSERDALHEEHEGEGEEGEGPLAPLPDGYHVDRVDASGFYAFVDWQFRQRWNLGAVYDRAEAAEEEDVTTTRYGIFGGFRLMEETTMVRLLLRRTDDDVPGSQPANEAVLQIVFSLGPHRAHWF